MPKAFALVSLLFAGCAVMAQPAPAPTDTRLCSAQLTALRADVAESYVVDFQIALEPTHGGLRAALVNGSDRMEFSSAARQGNGLELRLDQYDAVLAMRWNQGDTLVGEYVRHKGITLTRYEVVAHCKDAGASAEQNVKQAVADGSVRGNWEFTFAAESTTPLPAGEQRKAPAKEEAARFTQEGNHVEGTIAPVSGDYGMLSGEVSGGKDTQVHLSRFDGVHALRLDGHLVAKDRMEGVFHVAPGHTLDFVATRTAALSGFDEAEHLTTVANPSEAFRFHGVNAEGATITQDDPRFRGKVVLLDIFGTWCPNCHDEAPVLEELYRKFHERGLEIVGLSYEYVDDPVRSRRLLDIYRGKYSIGFPLLMAGTTDEGEIARTLPQLRNFGAFPTTIFLDRHGRVRLIHAGFSGPATGRLDEVKEQFERTIVTLLDEQ